MKINDHAPKAVLIASVILVLTACSRAVTVTPTPPAEMPPSPSPTAHSAAATRPVPIVSPPGEATQMIPPLPTPTAAVPQSLVEKAKADLARRLAVSMDEITVLNAESVVWSDASLGCPQEGMMYAQVLTPGYLIRLGSGNQEYEYHASRGTTVVYCENPLPPAQGAPPDV